MTSSACAPALTSDAMSRAGSKRPAPAASAPLALADDPAPKLARADAPKPGAAMTVKELAAAPWEFGKYTPYSNKKGGHFVNMEVFGRRPSFRLVTAPDFVRAPFDKKTWQRDDGGEPKEDYPVNITQEMVEDIKACEEIILDDIHKTRVERLGSQHKNTSKDQLRMLFGSKIAPPSKPGYEHLLRLDVSTKYPPPVRIGKLTDDGKLMIDPKPGSVSQLVSGAAVVPTISFFGGIWYVGGKCGYKLQLTEALIIKNRRAERESTMDLTNVEVVQWEDDDEPAPSIESADKPFIDDAALGPTSPNSQFPNADYGNIDG